MNPWAEIDGIQTEEEAKAKANKLPSWVKCMYCGERPKRDDYLGEFIPNSSALAHQSCMAKRGQVFGLNVGRTDFKYELAKKEGLI
jgi:hypothetical protein